MEEKAESRFALTTYCDATMMPGEHVPAAKKISNARKGKLKETVQKD